MVVFVGFLFSILIILALFVVILISLRPYRQRNINITLPAVTKVKERYNVAYYMREYVQPYSYLLEEQIKQLNLAQLPADAKAIQIWHFMNKEFSYLKDRDGVWRLPAETLSVKLGDEVSLALLFASLLITATIAPSRVRVVLGKVFGKIENGRLHLSTQPAEPVDYAWVNYLSDDNTWKLLDPLVQEVPPRLPNAYDLYKANIYIPIYQFNNQQAWEE